MFQKVVYFFKKDVNANHWFLESKKRFEDIEFPAKLLNYFSRSNKNNINQQIHINRIFCVTTHKRRKNESPRDWGKRIEFLLGSVTTTCRPTACPRLLTRSSSQSMCVGGCHSLAQSHSLDFAMGTLERVGSAAQTATPGGSRNCCGRRARLRLFTTTTRTVNIWWYLGNLWSWCWRSAWCGQRGSQGMLRGWCGC